MTLLGHFISGDLAIHSRVLLAYLDPGTGSIVLQAALAIVLGGLWAFKMSWQKVRDGVTKLFQRGGSHEQNDP